MLFVDRDRARFLEQAIPCRLIAIELFGGEVGIDDGRTLLFELGQLFIKDHSLVPVRPGPDGL